MIIADNDAFLAIRGRLACQSMVCSMQGRFDKVREGKAERNCTPMNAWAAAGRLSEELHVCTQPRPARVRERECVYVAAAAHLLTALKPCAAARPPLSCPPPPSPPFLPRYSLLPEAKSFSLPWMDCRVRLAWLALYR